MNKDTRHNERFDDIGKVEIPELCPLPGVLDNVSRDGCKIHYNVPVVVDLENEYEIKITFTDGIASKVFVLLCHPQWVKDENGCTEIGLKILPSQDYSRLGEYISVLGINSEKEDLSVEINNTVCKLI